MDTRSRTGCVKFFRRLISTSQPLEIQEIVERYDEQRKAVEESYIDIVLYSGGAVGYHEIMTMPLPAVQMLIERMNKRTEEMNKRS
jgi:hypothetical protein